MEMDLSLARLFVFVYLFIFLYVFVNAFCNHPVVHFASLPLLSFIFNAQKLTNPVLRSLVLLTDERTPFLLVSSVCRRVRLRSVGLSDQN